jgi:DNA-binding transcriptional ArsR family regulator
MASAPANPPALGIHLMAKTASKTASKTTSKAAPKSVASTVAKPVANSVANTVSESDQVFALAAELFGVMSAPLRLKIISSLCDGEKTVSELLSEINTTQPNMSQHLGTLYQAGVLGKRRDGVNIYYRIVNQRVVTLCRAVCVQIASEADLA